MVNTSKSWPHSALPFDSHSHTKNTLVPPQQQLWETTQKSQPAAVPVSKLCISRIHTVHAIHLDVTPCGPAGFELKRQIIFSFISSQHTHSMVGQGEDENNQYPHGDNVGMGTNSTDSALWEQLSYTLLLASGSAFWEFFIVHFQSRYWGKNAPSGLYSFHCTLQAGINVDAWRLF